MISPIHQLKTDQVGDNRTLIPDLSGIYLLGHQLQAIHFMLRWWSWVPHIRRALVADEFGHNVTISTVAAIIIWN